jgi:multisubunit Na+/H+ antiporter MnhE subunit
MTASQRKRWIGIAVIVAFATAWIVLRRSTSREDVIGGMAVAFAVLAARFIPAFWPRLQMAQRMCLILAAVGVLWALFFASNRNQNARVVSTSLETAGFVAICVLYLPFSKAMDALWLRVRRR